MKSKQLKIDKPCSENWEKMTPTERGRFCDKCSKNVVDLTRKTPAEIFKIYKENKGSMCGRIRPSQLEHAMPEIGIQYSLSLPYGKAAAGLMIAASVLGTEEIYAQAVKNPVEQVSAGKENQEVQSEKEIKEVKRHEELPICPVKQLSGKITDKDSGKPLVNARVSLVTIEKVYSTFTDKNGMYFLNLPEEEVREQNIISFSFRDIVRDKEPEDLFGGYYYSELAIVSQGELSAPINFQAEEELPIAGGISAYRQGQEPAVYYNGKPIKMEKFYELNFNWATGFNYHLNSEMAKALLGDKKGKYGANLYFDEAEVLE